jgi:hypothetical protein
MKFAVVTEQPSIFIREKLVRCLLIRIQDTKINNFRWHMSKIVNIYFLFTPKCALDLSIVIDSSSTPSVLM